MKAVASFGIVNADTSGPGAFLRAAKWYWDEVTDMFAAAGFSSIMIPKRGAHLYGFDPNAFWIPGGVSELPEGQGP